MQWGVSSAAFGSSGALRWISATTSSVGAPPPVHGTHGFPTRGYVMDRTRGIHVNFMEHSRTRGIHVMVEPIREKHGFHVMVESPCRVLSRQGRSLHPPDTPL